MNRASLFKTRLFLDSHCLITQDCRGEAEIVTSVSVADVGLRLRELCLTQLDNGT